MQSDIKKELVRKILHLSSLWMPLSIALLERWQATTLFLMLLLTMLFVEHGRKKEGKIKLLFERFFSFILRPHESGGRWTGASHMLLSCLLCTIFLHQHIAVFITAVMVISDSAAALVGKVFGRRKIGNKSLEGSAAFLLVSLFIAAMVWLMANQSPGFFLAAAAGALAATFAELFSPRLKLDDNLTLCLAGGGVAQILYALF